MRFRIPGVAAAALAVVFASTAQAQSIDPATFDGAMDVGESITIHKTITLGAGGADLVDLFFLADNTGSMFGVINSAKSGATTLLNELAPLGDYQFGAGRYLGDPIEGVSPATAYVQNAGLSSSVAGTQAGIDAWFASGGGDFPEANFFALKEVADNTAWRSGSQRLVIWFGDATSHTATVDEAGAIAALQAAGATVIAFNSQAAGGGIDGTFGGDDNQASDIAAATGGSLTNSFTTLLAADPNAFVDVVKGKIGEATSSLDLVFGTDFFDIYSSGLSFAFSCTDALGCMDVGAGESRTFDVTITALEEGTYDFSVFASGVAARELDHIVVGAGGGGSVVPEPSTWVMLATGLLGLGFVAWKRKEEEVA
jgi:hypothetical protein